MCLFLDGEWRLPWYPPVWWLFKPIYYGQFSIKPLVKDTNFLNQDCVKLMRTCDDDTFDLAVVDPPYGILARTFRGRSNRNIYSAYDKWDVKPKPDYWSELFRVSKNQIVWGGNYFEGLWGRNEYNTCFLVWDKRLSEKLSNFSMAELAWTSLDGPAKIFHYTIRNNKPKFHPTQKPVELYAWIYQLFTHPGDHILDTHLGSGTSAIAARTYGLKFTGCENNKKYYEGALKRLNKSQGQQKLIPL